MTSVIYIHVVLTKQNEPDDIDALVIYTPSTVLITSKPWDQTHLSQVKDHPSSEITFGNLKNQVPSSIYVTKLYDPSKDTTVASTNFDATQIKFELQAFAHQWTINFMC